MYLEIQTENGKISTNLLFFANQAKIKQKWGRRHIEFMENKEIFNNN